MEGRGHQRQGYGREALQGVQARAAELGVQEVEARAHLGNEGSVRLLLAVGYGSLRTLEDDELLVPR